MERRYLRQIIQAINYHHWEANPDPIDEVDLAEHRRLRDALVEKLKAQGKRVLLVKSNSHETCGRYVCEGEDGVNGYDPLPGTTVIEQVM